MRMEGEEQIPGNCGFALDDEFVVGCTLVYTACASRVTEARENLLSIDGSSAMALEGQSIGRYQLSHLLGSGGMGEVYLAIDVPVHRQVAIKVMRSEVSAYPNDTASNDAA